MMVHALQNNAALTPAIAWRPSLKQRNAGQIRAREVLALPVWKGRAASDRLGLH